MTTAKPESTDNGKIKAVAEPKIQWVTFALANETFGVNVMQVQEVVKYSKVAPVPGAPDYVHGIINLRGRVVTVINTRKRFGLPTGDITEQSRIIIAEAEQQVIGIMVDNVLEVVELDSSDIEDAPNVGNKITAEIIQGICDRNGTLLMLVDLNKLLTTAEWEEIARM